MILEWTTVKGATAVVIYLIVLGYVLKMISGFPNRYIPLVNIVVAPFLTVFLVAWPTPGAMVAGVRYPDAAAWATILMTGILLDFIAWITHAQILRRVIDNKVPALTPGRQTDKTSTVETHSDAAGTTKTASETKTTTDAPTTDATKPAIEEKKSDVANPDPSTQIPQP